MRGHTKSFAAAAALAATLGTRSLVQAGSPLNYEVVQPDSQASAMMLGLINQDQVLILDKVEGNAAKLPNGNPVWGSIMNLTDNSIRAVQVNTNTFCASGGTLPNGTWVVLGGNQPVQYGGNALNATSGNPYGSLDGRLAIRMMNVNGVPESGLNWLDNGSLNMSSPRWYPGVEVLATGEIVIIGGATGGGYINRNTPNVDPLYATTTNTGSIRNLFSGGANPTYEYFPQRANVSTVTGSYQGMQISNFMGATSGLNMYPHMYLMPSGKIFLNANTSNILWEHNQNIEEDLGPMPLGIVRVYPASGATAMLPLTPANSYTPTILFCGGTYLDTDDAWGNYTSPNINILGVTARKECHSITPENSDGTRNTTGFVQDDSLPEGRTMGQFIHLPTGEMLIVNGANKGTAGYGDTAWNQVMYNGQLVKTQGFSQEPTYRPVLYSPDQPAGSRFTTTGFGSSTIARLYHSSAVLLPDGSVLIGGSNPHVDVDLSMPASGITPVGYNTEYRLEKWYPSYYFEKRPAPQGMPSVITYGGSPFTVTMDANYMGSSANAKAAATKFMVIRPGFSTHAMNMGQRSMQLASTYTVNDNGSVTYTVNPMPTNPNLFVPGPALIFCTIAGIPSPGQFISVGMDMAKAGSVPVTPQIGAALQKLSSPVDNSKYNAPLPKSGSSFSTGAIIGVAAGGGAAILLLALIIFLCIRRKRKNATPKTKGAYSYANNPASGAAWNNQDVAQEYKAPPVAPFATQSRGSMGTFDSYRMGDMSGSANESREALGTYFDQQQHRQQSPAMQQSHSQHTYGTPLGSPAPMQSPVPYQQQGWGEHQGGDAGEFYNASESFNHGSQSYASDHSAGRYYDYPQASDGQHAQQYSYGQTPNSAQYYSQGNTNSQYGGAHAR